MTMNEMRAKKYPDTDTFHFYTANPKGKMTTDCVIRAITTALRQPYEQTLREMTEMTIKTGYMLNENKGINKYMESKGWVKCKSPRKADGTKYTGNEFCRTLTHPIYSEELDLYPKGYELNNLLVNIGGHHTVAIMSGQIWDTWNSGNGSIGIVWVKPA
jgi:hypothetical protein